MKKLISWIFLLPIAVVIVVFAIFNRTTVSFDLWPFAYRVDVPLFLAVFAGVFLGFLFGLLAMTFPLGRARRARRTQMYRAEDAEREARYLRSELDKAKSAAQADAAGGAATLDSEKRSVASQPPLI